MCVRARARALHQLSSMRGQNGLAHLPGAVLLPRRPLSVSVRPKDWVEQGAWYLCLSSHQGPHVHSGIGGSLVGKIQVGCFPLHPNPTLQVGMTHPISLFGKSRLLGVCLPSCGAPALLVWEAKQNLRPKGLVTSALMKEPQALGE